jgi:sugar phosphate isomerase/epimerase
MLEKRGIFLGGIGDEAAAGLVDQIEIQQQLGWDHLELRTIDGIALADIDPGHIDAVVAKVLGSRIKVPTLCSRIGNWAAKVTDDFQADLDELERLLTLADRLGSSFIRIMSYGRSDLGEAAWGREVTSRIGHLARIADRCGRVLVLENCAGWVDGRADRLLALCGALNSPSLRVLFDIGNPVAYGYHGPQFLREILPLVAHVHVKDAAVSQETGAIEFRLPGTGSARLAECLALLLQSEFRGMWSIEPHLALIPHLGIAKQPADLKRSYLAYGRSFNDLVQTLAGAG